jgi:glycosyltransferase involved in cell wall biosynthesis
VGDRGADRPRFCHLTSVHEVDDSRILRRECASLVRAGHDVAIIAGQEPTDPIEGVRVVAVGAPRSRIDRMTRIAWRLLRAARRERADVCHLHDPELIWIGVLLKLGGCRVVYDVHEDLPKQIMSKFWVPPRARRALSLAARVAEGLCARLFDAVVAATPSIAERFPAGKTVVVQNFPSVQAAGTPDDAAPPFEERKYAFAYTGGLTEVQGVRQIMEIATLLPAELTGVLAGWFDSSDLEKEVRASAGWRRVDHLGGIAPDTVLDVLRTARCGIVVDHPISNYLDSYSTKMFEYMACGIPVVCSDFPLWERIVGGADCGILVDPLDPSAAAAAIEKLARDPEEARRLGENGRTAVRARFNWEAEFRTLDALYRRFA